MRFHRFCAVAARSTLVGVLVGASIGPPAAAAPITFAFAGTVTDDPFGLAAFGAPISGRFTFESTATDAIPDLATGSYASHGSVDGFTVDVDGIAYTIAGNATVNVADDIGVDQYGVIAVDGGLTLELFLQDATHTALSSDALPLAAPVLAAFDLRQFRLFADDAQFLGSITALACTAGCQVAAPPGPPTGHVPEPGLPLLLVAGLAALLGRGRRPRRSIAPSVDATQRLVDPRSDRPCPVVCPPSVFHPLPGVPR